MEMINILVAMRLFASHWSCKKVLVKCDNQAVVSVLTSGRTKDLYLSACAHNVWYCAATNDIDARFVHIRGTANTVADLLSRWQGTFADGVKLNTHIPSPVWLDAKHELLYLHPEL